MENNIKQKVCLLNLGCKVNQYEIDSIIGAIEGEYEVYSKLCPADIYIINTCAVTQVAERKSRQIISKIKKQNPNAKIYVCGCASEHNAEQFLKNPQVEVVLGTFNKGNITKFFGKHGNFVAPISQEYEDNFLATNVRTRGYVKIQDGCNNFCSYCIIPHLRGRSRSRAIESIVHEATILSQNCREIVVTGINISDFKIDGKLSLIEVPLALSHLPVRVRLGSIEMNVITREFLNKARAIKNLCPHFHLSLQSGSDKVLSDMNRHYTTAEFYEQVALIREYYDNPAITTDIIVGFPTETEEDFQKTLEFVRRVGFSAVHYFLYSPREGTPASRLPQLDSAVKKQREERLKEVVAKVKAQYLKSLVGKTLEMLVEENTNEYYEGFSGEYVKCYLPNFTKKTPQNFCVKTAGKIENIKLLEKEITGKIILVVAEKSYKDGLLVKTK